MTIRVFAWPLRRLPRTHSPPKVTRFLGCWFGVFPLNVASICGTLKAKNEWKNLYSDYHQLRVHPFDIEELEEDDVIEDEKFELWVDKLNQLSKRRSKSYALTSSSKERYMGATIVSTSDLAGSIQRYVTEIFADAIRANEDRTKSTLLFLEQKHGLVSRHRLMMGGEHLKYELEGFKPYNPKTPSWAALDTCLDPEEYASALSSFRQSIDSLYDGVQSLNGLMIHLENRGHAEAPFVDGLTVELLPFQKQSLQWALEREQVQGGIHSYWISKLPEVEGADSSQDAYYDLLHGVFRTKKPGLVRGGFISEMMGRKWKCVIESGPVLIFL